MNEATVSTTNANMTVKDVQSILDIRITALKANKLPEADPTTGEVIVLNKAINQRIEVLVTALMEQKHIQAKVGDSRIAYLDLVKPSAGAIMKAAWRRHIRISKGQDPKTVNHIYSVAYNRDKFLPTLRAVLYDIVDESEDIESMMPITSLMKRIKRLVQKLEGKNRGLVTIGVKTFVVKS